MDAITFRQSKKSNYIISAKRLQTHKSASKDIFATILIIHKYIYHSLLWITTELDIIFKQFKVLKTDEVHLWRTMWVENLQTVANKKDFHLLQMTNTVN